MSGVLTEQCDKSKQKMVQDKIAMSQVEITPMCLVFFAGQAHYFNRCLLGDAFNIQFAHYKVTKLPMGEIMPPPQLGDSPLLLYFPLISIGAERSACFG